MYLYQVDVEIIDPQEGSRTWQNQNAFLLTTFFIVMNFTHLSFPKSRVVNTNDYKNQDVGSTNEDEIAGYIQEEV